MKTEGVKQNLALKVFSRGHKGKKQKKNSVKTRKYLITA